MKKRKQKGYVLAFVMILMFALTILLAQTFNLLIKNMFYSKKHVHKEFSTTAVTYSDHFDEYEEIILNGWI